MNKYITGRRARIKISLVSEDAKHMPKIKLRSRPQLVGFEFVKRLSGQFVVPLLIQEW